MQNYPNCASTAWQWLGLLLAISAVLPTACLVWLIATGRIASPSAATDDPRPAPRPDGPDGASTATARRRRRTSATATGSPAPASPESTDDSDATSNRAAGRAARQPRNGTTADLARQCLASHTGEQLSAVQVAKLIDRPSGGVANALERLVALGIAERAQERPRRYTANASAPAVATTTKRPDPKVADATAAPTLTTVSAPESKPARRTAARSGETTAAAHTDKTAGAIAEIRSTAAGRTATTTGTASPKGRPAARTATRNRPPALRLAASADAPAKPAGTRPRKKAAAANSQNTATAK